MEKQIQEYYVYLDRNFKGQNTNMFNVTGPNSNHEVTAAQAKGTMTNKGSIAPNEDIIKNDPALTDSSTVRQESQPVIPSNQANRTTGHLDRPPPKVIHAYGIEDSLTEGAQEPVTGFRDTSTSPSLLSYSEAASKQGPWILTPKNQRSQRNSRAKSHSSVVGRSPVKSSCLYVKNISQEEGVSDEDIIEQVKSHAAYYGVKIMSARVVKNRFADNIVGCRITVPDEDAHLCLRNYIWPKPIECREWERGRGLNRSRRQDIRWKATDLRKSNPNEDRWDDKNQWHQTNSRSYDRNYRRDRWESDNSAGWYEEPFREY